MKRTALIVSILAWPTLLAHAWEGLCRPEGSVPSRTDIAQLDAEDAVLTDSIEGWESTPACAPGLEAARGVQLGEHTSITVEAMHRAGLPDGAFQPLELDYSTNATRVRGGPVMSIAPAAVGAMQAHVARAVFIAELSEVPDISHSLSDYLLGNEHCFVPFIQSRNLGELEACHTFGAHMGPINATHWAPLNKHMYELYHQHALRVMERCRAMRPLPAQASFPPALVTEMHAALRMCEQEALAIQSYGSHYLEDAWSAGHMFNRWGSPIAADTDDARLRAFIATAVVGLIHGSRGVVRRHDQVNMPGPFELDGDELITHYRQSSLSFAIPGGGDLYLRSITARHPQWSVDQLALSRGSRTYRPYDAMLDCVALGFREVYGSDTGELGRATAAQPIAYPFGGDLPLTSALDERCWDARLTDQSMMLGLGGTFPRHGIDFDLTAEDLASLGADPGIMTRMVVDGVVDEVTETGVRRLSLDEAFANVAEAQAQLRREIGALAELYVTTARRGDASVHTSLAEGGGPETFMGVARSSTFVDLLRDDGVAYLERWPGIEWTDRGGSECSSQTDCLPGEFCDYSHVDYNGGGQPPLPRPRCVGHEAGILRAFRPAELRYFCADERTDALELARAACMNAGDCEACVDVVLPHLRNACGMGDFVPMRDGVDHRSLCEIAGVPDVRPVYARYRPGDATAAHDAALALCRGQISGPPGAIDRSLALHSADASVEPGPTTPRDSDSPQGAQTYVCGGTAESIWYRFHHPPGPAHVHEYAAKPKPNVIRDPVDVNDIELALYLGPRCAEADRLPATAELRDTNGDGTLDALVIAESVPAGAAQDVCLRVRARNEIPWTYFRVATNTIAINWE